MNLPIYLDYAASTPVDSRVAEKMAGCLTQDGNFGNPASRSHIYGWRAEEAVETARNQVAELIGADSREIVWTSGATESNNLALKGIVEAYRHAGKQSIHIVTSAIEHKSVLDVCADLQHKGVDVTYLEPDSEGLIDVAQVANAIREDTVLVSLMHVNNEIGVLNDIDAIGNVCRERQVLFHVDAAQSAGKVAIDLKHLPVDMMSFSAHKVYGPKGVGALYVRRQSVKHPLAQIHGGGQERKMRSGTLATHQIVGMGEAFAIAEEGMVEEAQRIQALRQQFCQQIQKLDRVTFNGSQSDSVPGIVNVSFEGVDGESLLLALKSVAVSTGSACASATVEPSYVLTALGIGRELAHSSIRFSIGRYTSNEDIQVAANHVVDVVNKLRKMSVQQNRTDVA